MAAALLFSSAGVAFAKDNGASNRTMFRGMSGQDVIQLQTMLALDPSIYPQGSVTGYYGTLTEQAVKRLQKKFGIDQLGIVGPKTRGILVLLLTNSGTTTATTTVGQGKHDNDQGDNDDQDEEHGEHRGAGKVVLCHKGETITVGAPAIAAHILHGDLVGACQGTGGTGSTTPPDVTAPVVSGITLSGLASTSVTVNWTTNEAANSKVYFGTTTPLNLGSASVVSSSTLGTNHSLMLSGLATSTTYYFVVESKDAANNTATSSQNSFVTLAI